MGIECPQLFNGGVGTQLSHEVATAHATLQRLSSLQLTDENVETTARTESPEFLVGLHLDTLPTAPLDRAFSRRFLVGCAHDDNGMNLLKRYYGCNAPLAAEGAESVRFGRQLGDVNSLADPNDQCEDVELGRLEQERLALL